MSAVSFLLRHTVSRAVKPPKEIFKGPACKLGLDGCIGLFATTFVWPFDVALCAFAWLMPAKPPPTSNAHVAACKSLSRVANTPVETWEPYRIEISLY